MARRQPVRKKPVVNKQQRIQKLADDIKSLLQLDSCEPVFLPDDELRLHMQSGGDELDLPITTIVHLKDHEEIKQTIIKCWIIYLQMELRRVMHGR